MTKLSGLYGITSQEMLLDNGDLFDKTEQALKGGMRIFQYRDKHTVSYQSNRDLMQLKKLCHKYNALFIINDNVELCKQIGADGVHIGLNDANYEYARNLLGENSLIGVSCYNQYELAEQAVQKGANYIAFGAFYPSPTKPNTATASTHLLMQSAKLNTPICAIGGITTSNAKILVQKGTNMLAVISDLFNTNQTQTNAEQFSQLF